MSDGEFHMFEGTPEEFQEMMRARQDRAMMEYEDTIHGIYRMIEDVNPEHLKVFMALLHNLSDSPQALGYWEGVMSSAIARREKVCPACRKDHDKEAERLAEEHATALRDDPNVRGDRLVKMHEYHVEPVDDDDLAGTVRCIGILPDSGPCGMTYPNLEDRMVRKADECSGCFARSGQG